MGLLAVDTVFVCSVCAPPLVSVAVAYIATRYYNLSRGGGASLGASAVIVLFLAVAVFIAVVRREPPMLAEFVAHPIVQVYFLLFVVMPGFLGAIEGKQRRTAARQRAAAEQAKENRPPV